MRGTLKTTMALLAAASFGGWVVFLGVLLGAEADMRLISIAFWTITVLYGLLALAVGNVQGRRYGRPGVLVAVLGALLSWLILEFFFYLFEIGTVQMRAPLMAGIALAIVGAVVGAQRASDLSAPEVDLEAEDAPTEGPEPVDAGAATDPGGVSPN